MDVFDCIKTRRSIRSYSDQPIDKADIDIIIESAVWAPSAKNRQPWSVYVKMEHHQKGFKNTAEM